jgi:hypothetical protein
MDDGLIVAILAAVLLLALGSIAFVFVENYEFDDEADDILQDGGTDGTDDD